MENHHFEWENPLYLWPLSIAMLVHQRVNPIKIPLNPSKPPFSYGFPVLLKCFLTSQLTASPSPKKRAAEPGAPHGGI